VVALVVSSLVVRVAAPADGAGVGFRLVFEGEIVGPERDGEVAVSVCAQRGSSRAHGRGGFEHVGGAGRFRVESGPLGGAGDYAFQVDLGARALYRGFVSVETAGVRYVVAREHFLGASELWFDTWGNDDAPVLAGTFWCEGDDAMVARLNVVLYGNGRPVLHSSLRRGARSGVELRVIDRVDDAGTGLVLRRVQLRMPSARAFVLGKLPDVLDLSAHPGIYAIRVTHGDAPIARLLFEIDWHGVVRDMGAVERRVDGTPVMLVGSGPRFGPGSARFVATLDPVYARWFAATRVAAPVVLDAAHLRALHRIAHDLVQCERAVEFDAERAAARLHDLVSRIEEIESAVPAGFPVRLGGSDVPFESLREHARGLLAADRRSERGRNGRVTRCAS
jgi:hypothetical protein